MKRLQRCSTLPQAGNASTYDGHGNITVQIVGDDSQVTIAGAAALRLTMFPRRRKEGGDIGLLSAYTQSIARVGRDREMAELRAWLASGRDIAIQVRTGKAGTGKTRLAFDLCDELLKEGEWQAGFVNGDQLANLTEDAGARWGWEQPTLSWWTTPPNARRRCIAGSASSRVLRPRTCRRSASCCSSAKPTLEAAGCRRRLGSAAARRVRSARCSTRRRPSSFPA